MDVSVSGLKELMTTNSYKHNGMQILEVVYPSPLPQPGETVSAKLKVVDNTADVEVYVPYWGRIEVERV